MFAGYLVLDAWVGNQDRHDQNWAALRQASSPGGLRLAASYDHASSLGFNLLDTRRDALLSSGGVASWAQRGRSHRFEHDPARPRNEIPTLVQTAHGALDLAGDRSRRHWLEQLRTLDGGEVEAVGGGCFVSVDDVALRPDETASSGRSIAWDAGRSPGSLIVAWQHPRTRLISPVGLLEHGPELGYRFRYLRRATELADFQPFLSFPEWRRTYLSARLFPLFSQRIMSPRRPDFSQFLRQLHLDDDASPWEQLARSEGRRTGDTVQVFPIPSVRTDGSNCCRFLVHGIRHVTGGQLPPLPPGEELVLRGDPANPVNPAAVLVCTREGEPLGYVPDLLLEHLQVVQAAGTVRLIVEHVNGPEAPTHLRLLARLDGQAPAGCQPMAGPHWHTY